MGSSASKMDSNGDNLKSDYQVPKFDHKVPKSLADFAKIIEEESKFTVSQISSILEFEKGEMNDKELYDVVRQFFYHSSTMSGWCNEIQSSLDRARDSQLNLRAAVRRFKVGDGANRSEKYKLPLEALEKFKNSGDPFTGLSETMEEVQKQEEKLSEKIKLYQDKLDKRRIKKEQEVMMARIAIGVIFISLILGIVACQVCVAISGIILAPDPSSILGPACATATTIPTLVALESVCKKYYDGLKRKQDLLSSMSCSCLIEIKYFVDIKNAAKEAGDQLQSLKRKAEFTLEGEEEEVKIGFEEIEKKMDKYAKSLEELGKCVEECSENLKEGRKLIQKKLS